MPDREHPPPRRILAFGPFRLFPEQRLLLESGNPVRLGSRALDILITLTEHAGELMSNDELIARTWPGTFVEGSNLRVHVAALRKALDAGQAGDRYITNIPGRGYSFVAQVSVSIEPVPAIQRSTVRGSIHNLPDPLTRLAGREEVVRTLVSQLPQQRFVTIVGPGGIGKTSVILVVAHELFPFYENVQFIDLASLSDPRLVTSALATALGLSVRSDDSIGGLIEFLKDREMLIVLDSCEHVIEAAAVLAEAIVRGAPRVHLLATSREPLRAQGEYVVRLGPLGLPPVTGRLTAAEALAYPAVQLLVERAAANLDTFELGDADARIASDICIRLDGIALAIELAAARVEAVGLRELLDHLDDRFRILTRGRRTALPRHRTLMATLDWSYELLPEAERIVLRRLAVFTGPFTLDSACRVVADDKSEAADVVDAITDLAAKSLVSVDVGGRSAEYRLLDTTRAYAREKLAESGELELLRRRHAENYRALFERAELEWEEQRTVEWLGSYLPMLDNLRAALDWAFSPEGDASIARALTVTAVPLWLQLSLIEECRRRVTAALATLEAGASADPPTRMKLYAALGWSLLYSLGPTSSISAAWTTALDLARDLGNVDYQLRALWGLWASVTNFGTGVKLAREFHRLAKKNPLDRLVGDRMIGSSLHFIGHQGGARKHIDRMLADYATPGQAAHVVRFQFDQRVMANITLARVLWLQGFADQAMLTVERNIAYASSTDHTLSLCNALVQACPVAIFAGDSAAAQHYGALALDLAVSRGEDIWRVYCNGFKGQLLISQGQARAGLPILQKTVDELRNARFILYHAALLGALAEGLADIGQLAQARLMIDDALARSQESYERWSSPELLRVKGEIVLRQGGPDAIRDSEVLFGESLDLARRQQALAWELRTATSLAGLWRSQDRRQEAGTLLQSVHARFNEGFETPDYRKATALLNEFANWS